MTVRPAVIVEAAGARWAVTFDKAEVSWGAGLSALGTVVATYVDAYRLPALEREALHAAHASLTRADIALGPRLTVRERARSVPAGVALDVEVGLEAPLFDAAALVTRDLAMADLELRQAEAAGALSLQLAAYLKDRTAAPLLRRALAAASDALPDPLSLPSAPEALRPEDRDRLEAFASLADTWRWLLSTSASLEERIGHGPPVPQHPTPSPHEVIAALTPSLARVIGEGVAPPHEGVTASTAYASVAGPPAPRPGAGVMWEEALDACLVGSASLRVAAARRSSLRRAEALDVAPDLTFTAGLQLSHELTLGVPAHGTSHMSVRVEGRYRLPRSWPVAGTLAATFGTGGLSQELEVSWPSAVFSPPPTDPEEQYDSEVAAARSEARSLLDAVHGAISDLASVRRALAWQVLDADPRLSPPGARALVGEPFGSAWNSVTAPLRNALLDPRLRVAMGELRAAAAVIDLAAFCGVLTPAAGALPAR